MAGNRGVLAGLLERELLGTRRAFLPPSYASAFSCTGPHAGVIAVDPDGDPCPPYAITFNQVVHGCRFLTVGDEEGSVSIVDAAAEQLPASLYTDAAVPPRATWLAHNNTIFDLAWAKNDSVLYTASGDQHVGVWDTAAGRLRVYAAGHDGSVKVVAPHTSAPDVFASGSRDGGILLWDLRTPTCWSASRRRMQLAPVGRINIASAPPAAAAVTAAAAGGGGSPAPAGGTPGGGRARGGAAGGGSTRRSVTSLLFLPHDDHTLVSSSDMDGTVRLWDLRRLGAPTRDLTLPANAAAAAGGGAGGGGSAARRGSSSGLGGGGASRRGSSRSATGDASAADGAACWLSFACPGRSSRPAGITSMALSPAGDMLLVSSIDSTHYLYRLSALDAPPVATFVGHRSDSFCVKATFSPCGSAILSGSSDGRAYIWAVDDPSCPPVSLPGHAGEVTAVAWCPQDYCQLATAADDATLRVWRMDREAARYRRTFAHCNHSWGASRSEQALWSRFGLGASEQQQQQPSGVPAASFDAQAAAKPGPHQHQAVQRSICSPTTPQLPFWRAHSAAEVAGGVPGQQPGGAAPTATGGSATPPPQQRRQQLATDAPGSTVALPAATECNTPAHQLCKGGPDAMTPTAAAAAAAAAVGPAAAVQAQQQQQRSTATPKTRLRQLTLPEQLSAAKAAREAAAAAAAAAAPASSAAAGVQPAGAQAAHDTHHGPPVQQLQQQQQDAGQVFTAWMQQLAPSSGDDSPPAASARPDGGDDSGGLARGRQQQQQLTPPPPAVQATPAGRGLMPPLHAGLASLLAGTAAEGPGSSGAVRRGGRVEAITPWSLPSPLRQQRQAEQAQLEAATLQRQQRQRRSLMGVADSSQDGGGGAAGAGAEAAAPHPALPGAGGACRLLQDEFEVFCDGSDTAGAAPVQQQGVGPSQASGLLSPATSSHQQGGASCQENDCRQAELLQLDAAARAAQSAGAAAAAAATTCTLPGGADAAAAGVGCLALGAAAGCTLADDVEMVPCSLEQQQTQTQQHRHTQPDRPVVVATQASQARQPQPQHQQQQAAPAGPLLPPKTAELLGVAARNPLADLSPLLSTVVLAPGSGGDGGRQQAAAAAAAAAAALLHRTASAPGLGGSPARVLALHGSPLHQQPAMGRPGVGDSYTLPRLQSAPQHGRPQQALRGAAGMLLSPPRGLQQHHQLLAQAHQAHTGSPHHQHHQQHQQHARSPLRHSTGPNGDWGQSPGQAAVEVGAEPGGWRQRSRLAAELLPHAAAAAAAAAQQEQDVGAATDQAHGGGGGGQQQAGVEAAAGGGIRRSAVTHNSSASARKRQCRLADLWAAKQPEIEDGASRFSGV